MKNYLVENDLGKMMYFSYKPTNSEEIKESDLIEGGSVRFLPYENEMGGHWVNQDNNKVYPYYTDEITWETEEE